MGVYESDRYQHIKVECQLIEQALARNIPILGICLGSQILAHVLGAPVRKHTEREAGWHQIQLTAEGKKDPLLSHFEETETVFQMHGDTFDIPKEAVHLASSQACSSQAFRYGKKAYGIQFHLEVDPAMVHRFLHIPANRSEMEELNGKHTMERIETETNLYLNRSMELSKKTFLGFIDLFGIQDRAVSHRLGHGKIRD